MEEKQTSGAHPQCRLCRDGTYATHTIQTFVGDEYPWEPYCDPCGAAFASVIRDGSQNRDPEVRVLPVPPDGKAAPKSLKVPKVTAPVKGTPTPPVAPKVDAVPRKSLAEMMRPTAPRSLQDTDDYDLLSLLGMK